MELSTQGAEEPNTSTDSTAIPEQQIAPGSPSSQQKIGRYMLIRQLGRGGMGEVYEAEQTEPVHRKVALKLIKGGMDTQEVLARFDSERQALAIMNHPNIARMLDGGVTAQGLPYFVMDYIEGVPITEYCDSHGLSNPERLDLFIQVCAGVQHAHQKGIVHRDIKPSNVLVTVEDPGVVPKIIDFGLAKALGSGEADMTQFTHVGQVIGTPDYMSPEQVSGADIDTRTDVYSLGVLLYQLLVGMVPFGLKESPQGGWNAFQKRVCEQEPVRPSVRVSSWGQGSGQAAKKRRIDAASWIKELQGDLDWITLRALEKDRTRRYQSPSELAEDIKRHLYNEPILARPHSTAYSIKKFVRRHRIGVAAAAIAGLAVLIGIAGITVGLLRAVRSEKRATEEAATAKQVSDFMVGLFEVSDPSESRGNSVTAREILDRGVERINRELSAQPPIRTRLLLTMGRVYRSLGLWEPSARLLEEALQLAKQAVGDEHPDIADYELELAWLYFRWGRLDDALPLCRKALAIRRKALGTENPSTAWAMQNLGILLRDKGEYAEAKQLLEDSLSIREKTLGPTHLYVAHTLYHLGWLSKLSGHLEEARRFYERALPIYERQLGADHPDTIWCLSDLAVVNDNMGDLDSARVLYEKVLETRERVLGSDHPDLADSLNNLGQLLARAGDHMQAKPLLERALTIMEKAQSADSFRIAEYLNNLGLLYVTIAEYSKAQQLFERSLRINEKALGVYHPSVALSLKNLGQLFVKMKDYARAKSYFERGLAIAEKTYGVGHPEVGDYVYALADLYSRQAKYSQAEPFFQRSLAIQERTLKPDSPVLAGTLEGYAGLLRKTGNSVEAEKLEVRAKSIRQDHGQKFP